MRNLGNTCFAAAAVWALRACPRAREAVRRTGGSLAPLLIRVMEDPRSPAWPDLVRALDSLVQRRNREPHDSHELLCRIVEALGMEERFRVKLVTKLRCESCGKIGAARDSNIFVVSEPSGSVVSGLIAAHSPKWVEDRECDEGCRKRCRAAIRTVPRAPAPVSLMVRVSNGEPGTWVEHAVGYCGTTYKVRAVIVYKGNGRGGHYVCCIPSPGGGWALHDDDDVRKTDVRTVSGASLIANAHTVLYEIP
jgi:hypothetical protein